MSPGSSQQHQKEILSNREAWHRKPLLREEYHRLYQRLVAGLTDDNPEQPRVAVEIGSGMGQLREVIPGLICTDLFPNPWIDHVCSAYALPFEPGTVSDLILIDVFHHLEKPFAFLAEAGRCLRHGGRVHILDPYISLTSRPVFHFGHHEPIGRPGDIDHGTAPPAEPGYYAAQGNATHIFFRNAISPPPDGFSIVSRQRWSCWSYLLSGGFSKPAFYPPWFAGVIRAADRILSMSPALFAGRCLVVLQKQEKWDPDHP
jgi:hypothetical protein